MLGEFTYCNPTRLYFGKEALDGLRQELKKYGPQVLLCYGGGSIKKNGIYEKVTTVLKECGKRVIEDAGVMPNPTVQKLYEGCRLARENAVDLILAVGGGSVCDYAKAVSVSAYCEEDPWEKYYLRMEDVVFEVFSAIGTVGMSTGITRDLSAASRIIVVLLMYCGRIGSMSFALSFMERKKVAPVKLPEEKVMIG